MMLYHGKGTGASEQRELLPIPHSEDAVRQPLPADTGECRPALISVSREVIHNLSSFAGVVLGNAAMAAEEMPPDSEQLYYLTQILKAAEHLREGINQLSFVFRDSQQKRIPLSMMLLAKSSLRSLESFGLPRVEKRFEVCGKDQVAADLEAIFAVLLRLNAVLVKQASGCGCALHISAKEHLLCGEKNFSCGVLNPGRYVQLELAVMHQSAGFKDTARCGLPAVDEFGFDDELRIVLEHDGVLEWQSSDCGLSQVSVWLPSIRSFDMCQD